MPSVNEALNATTQLGAALRASTEAISGDQQITFDLYVKLVLPLDGYVFWVRAATITPGSLINSGVLNGAGAINAIADVEEHNSPYAPIRFSFDATGSLHYQTTAQQTDDANYSLNQIVFTSEVPINDLDAVSPTLLYIGTWQETRFAFSERRQFYQQAGIYHYGGTAVTAIMNNQIIDNPIAFDTQNVIVSNSMPLWLSMNQMNPPIPFIPSQNLPLYPSGLVPQNLMPPYGVVDIKNTKALQPTPYFDRCSNTWQLLEDEVEVTIFGYHNFNATDFRDYVYNISTWYTAFGVMNYPIIYEVREGSRELQTLAMKKRIVFRINYYQSRIRDVARQYITNVIANFITTDEPEPGGRLILSTGGDLLTVDGYRIVWNTPPIIPDNQDNNAYLVNPFGQILTNADGQLITRTP